MKRPSRRVENTKSSVDLTWTDDDADQPYQRRFERQVELHAARPAVVCASGRCTYGELNERANRLAHWLLEQRGPASEPVAVLMEDYLDIYTAWLGILKAGKFFCALEPRDPAARHLSILRELQHPLLLVDAHTEPGARSWRDAASVTPLAGTHHERSDNPVIELDAASLYSIAFTSGSTGRPRACAVRIAER